MNSQGDILITSQPMVEAKLGAQLTEAQQTYFDAVLASSIDAYIAQQTGVTFGSTETVDVYVNGSDGSMLVIPTMHDITAVTHVDNAGTESVLPINEYRAWPQGASDTLSLRKLNGSWEEGIENYKVSGQLGHKAVPAELLEVAAELAVNSLNANVNNYKSEKVGDWQVTYGDAASISPQSLSILGSYKRLSRSI